MQPLRIGINALYMIPGGVGGTEIYLRVPAASVSIVSTAPHKFVVFVNAETRCGLALDRRASR